MAAKLDMMEEQPRLFQYSESDLLLERNADCKESEFDTFVRNSWRKASENGHFNYVLNLQTKIRQGYPQLVLQLNPERGSLRRASVEISDMHMPFNPEKFHFNKIKKREVLCYLKPPNCNQDEEHMLVINVSPIEFGHILLVPSPKACLPQRLNLTAAQLSLDLVLLSAHKGLRVGFNSLCALASVNHLHVHAWYLDHALPIEACKVARVCERLYVTVDHFAPAFALQLHDSTKQQLAEDLFAVTNYLQRENIAHNVFITQGSVFSEAPPGQKQTIRVFIWPRKSATGIKPTNGVIFHVAVAEFAGQIPIYDKNAFETLSTEEILDVVNEQLLSEKEMQKISQALSTLFSSNQNGSK